MAGFTVSRRVGLGFGVQLNFGTGVRSLRGVGLGVGLTVGVGVGVTVGRAVGIGDGVIVGAGVGLGSTTRLEIDRKASKSFSGVSSGVSSEA